MGNLRYTKHVLENAAEVEKCLRVKALHHLDRLRAFEALTVAFEQGWPEGQLLEVPLPSGRTWFFSEKSGRSQLNQLTKAGFVGSAAFRKARR